MAAQSAAPGWNRLVLLSSSRPSPSQLVSDVEAGRRAQSWVGDVIGERLDGDFPQALKNGQALCRIMNAIRPGTIQTVETSRSPFKEMANISAFLRGCREIGVPPHALFETLDLYNEKRLSQVVRCLFALSERVHHTVPAFKGPYLGSVDRPKADTVRRASGGKATHVRDVPLPPADPSPTEVVLCKPSSHGSLNVDPHTDDSDDVQPPQGLSPMAKVVDPLTCQPEVEETSGGTTTALPLRHGMAGVPAPCESATEEELGTVGGRSSLDGNERKSFTRDDGRRLRREAIARADAELEAALWIEGVTGVTFPGKFSSSLRDGVLLCKVVNAIQPGLIPKIHKGGVRSRELENIDAFLSSCRTIGVPECFLFDGEHIYETRDLHVVVQCLHGLDAAVQSRIPSFGGPFLGAKSDAFSSVNATGLRQQLGKGPGARGGIDLAALGKGPGVGKQVGAGGVDTKQPNVKDDATAMMTPADSPSGNVAPAHVANGRVSNSTAPLPSTQTPVGQRPKSLDPVRRSGLLAHAPSPRRGVSPFRRKVRRSATPTPRQDTLPDTARVEKTAGEGRSASAKEASVRRLERYMSADHSDERRRRSKDPSESGAPLFNDDIVSQVQAFVEFQTRISWRVRGDMYESLRDGWQLVLLANSIRPGSIRRVYNSIMPTKHVQNIENFLTFCRRIGVPRASVFEVPDLYAKRDLAKVVQTLLSIRSLATDVGFARAINRAYSSIETSLLSSAAAKAAAGGASDYGDVPVEQA